MEQIIKKKEQIKCYRRKEELKKTGRRISGDNKSDKWTKKQERQLKFGPD